MIDRFLRYSMLRSRRIRLFIMEGTTVRSVSVQVISFDENNVSYLLHGRKKPHSIPRGDILSASYARGDDGDTLLHETADHRE